ncbi:Alpha/Beta hydrolase protein [Tricladium varicosporioides]|nr:Alpha/Beta hydrolase protein [Hymenoscyphus varicosporioides]
MDSSTFIQTPPPLDPAWLAHEQSAGLLLPKPVITDPSVRQKTYSQTCKALNDLLLSDQEVHLTHGITIRNFTISSLAGHQIPIRHYTPGSSPNSGRDEERQQEDREINTVIYYHGGGLYVGDLDSEDLTCRRIIRNLDMEVYSVDYRLMPQHCADDALADALFAFTYLRDTVRRRGKVIVMGSSSGGQLAAQVSILENGNGRGIDGVLLRCPVLCDAVNLPTHWTLKHTSMSPSFHTSLLSSAALTSENRTKEKLPLEVEELDGMPRHWIQVCTNDIYYSDGVCYAEGLREKGVDVRRDVVVGWPHTFWLKAPLLERAVRAEKDMLMGLKWLVAG